MGGRGKGRALQPPPPARTCGALCDVMLVAAVPGVLRGPAGVPMASVGAAPTRYCLPGWVLVVCSEVCAPQQERSALIRGAAGGAEGEQ